MKLLFYGRRKKKYGCLPVNAGCARKWLKDNQHLEKEKTG